MMQDVMLDLETWGLHPGCGLRSIGAVAFDPWTDDTGPQFHVNVLMDYRLQVEAETFEWWRQQSREARQAVLAHQVPLDEGIASFYLWWKTIGAMTVWAHGAAFDPPIFEAAARIAGHKTMPWHYREV